MDKPAVKPNNPCFSSGPCAKRPGWSLSALEELVQVGRSHRASPAKKQLKDVIDRQKKILGIPDDYLVGILPASDTGAFELALWNIIGSNPNGADVLAWESFSGDWLKDIEGQLKPANYVVHKEAYGKLPDLSAVDQSRDVVFVWNGTTSGVRVPNGDWISADREGLTLCDATSAVFAYDLPWDKLDVTTWSWQKVLGGEGAHGMLVLSPRAVERILSYKPAWPLPKIFRIKKGDKINAGIFEGATINTPSMLAVADCTDALNWVESIGGLQACITRTDENFCVIRGFVENNDWVDFLPVRPEIASKTSVCLKITDAWFNDLSEDDQNAFIKSMAKLLDSEGAAYDIAGYRDAPPGLRIWCGATVEKTDLIALTPWLSWAFEATRAEEQKKRAA